MLGKLPFPKWLLTTQVKIYHIAISEDGEPIPKMLYDGLSNYTEKTKQILDKERKLVTLTGKVIVPGDINPGVPIEGFVEIGIIKEKIFTSIRPRNPDGSVFSTELDLM
jgi:hypothetical protein